MTSRMCNMSGTFHSRVIVHKYVTSDSYEWPYQYQCHSHYHRPYAVRYAQCTSLNPSEFLITHNPGLERT